MKQLTKMRRFLIKQLMTIMMRNQMKTIMMRNQMKTIMMRNQMKTNMMKNHMKTIRTRNHMKTIMMRNHMTTIIMRNHMNTITTVIWLILFAFFNTLIVTYLTMNAFKNYPAILCMIIACHLLQIKLQIWLQNATQKSTILVRKKIQIFVMKRKILCASWLNNLSKSLMKHHVTHRILAVLSIKRQSKLRIQNLRFTFAIRQIQSLNATSLLW